MSNVHLTPYLALLKCPQAQILTSAVLNPESLLLDPEEQPVLACAQVTDHLQCGQLDPRDQPLGKADVTLFSNGGSYVQDRFRCAGGALVTLPEVSLSGHNLCPKGHQPKRQNR